LVSEVSGVHQDSISPSGSCLESVKVHSLILPHTSYTLGVCDVTLGLLLALTLGLPFGPQPCNPFVLVASPKARVATLSQNKNPNGKHFFFPFKVVNIIAQYANNKHN